MSQGHDDDTDQKIKQFLIQFQRTCRIAPEQVDELERFVRMEVEEKRAEEKSQTEWNEEQPVCDEVTHSEEDERDESQEQEESECAQSEQIRRILRAHQCEEH